MGFLTTRPSSWNTLRADEMSQQHPSQDMGSLIIHLSIEQRCFSSHVGTGYDVRNLSQASNAAERKGTLASLGRSGSDKRAQND